MKKDAIISVHGRQMLDDADSDVVTLTTAGRFYRRDGKYYISYDESELTGLEGTRTTVKFDEGLVTVTRTGQYPSQLMFEKGKRHMSLYHTDAGDLTVSVCTERLDLALNDRGGTLDVDYAIEIEHAHVGMNHLKIDIKAQDTPRA